MRRKLPSTAFDAYVSLGAARSYEAVARQFGVTKRAVTACAEREDWQGRLADAQEKARIESDRKAADELVAMNARHDGIAGAIETAVVKLMRELGNEATMADLRMAALTIEATQRVRRTSRGLDDAPRITQAAEPAAPLPPRIIEWRLMTPKRIAEERAKHRVPAERSG